MSGELCIATCCCEQCHHDAHAVCHILHGTLRRVYCVSCMQLAKGMVGVQVEMTACQRCHNRVEVIGNVALRGQYRTWCLACIGEWQSPLNVLSNNNFDITTMLQQKNQLLGDHGYVLNGRYQLVSLLGKGGFGAVYKAEDMLLSGRHVAVKEMIPGDARIARTQQSSFEREALMLARLFHPQLPRIYDYFSSPDGRYYLVMDYICGQTLEQIAQTSRLERLPLEQVLGYALQLTNVLSYLHSQVPNPIVFRDIKPSNVIIGPQGVLFLVDFGIARFFKGGQAHDTSAFGTPGYAAPEQYGTAQTSIQSDIYSLGVLLHRLLSGENPARAPFTFTPLCYGTKHVWSRIDRLVRRMVDMLPQHRPTSADEVRTELLRILANMQAETSVIKVTELTHDKYFYDCKTVAAKHSYNAPCTETSELMRSGSNS